MKKFMLPLMLIVSMFFVSCSLIESKIPEVKKSASEKITAAIVKTGECSAVSEIKADVDKLLKVESADGMVVKAMGSSAPEGAQEEGLVSEICKAAAKLALPALMAKGVPEKWECSLSDLGGKVGLLAEEACGKIDL